MTSVTMFSLWYISISRVKKRRKNGIAVVSVDFGTCWYLFGVLARELFGTVSFIGCENSGCRMERVVRCNLWKHLRMGFNIFPVSSGGRLG